MALRSHDQIPASHWSTPQNSFKDFGGNLFQRCWRKIVLKISEEICLKDFGGKLFQIFWRKFFSKILEENCFKDFGGKLCRSYYPHRWRDSLSPVCGIFFTNCSEHRGHYSLLAYLEAQISNLGSNSPLIMFHNKLSCAILKPMLVI